jgi:hypothetical protein
MFSLNSLMHSSSMKLTVKMINVLMYELIPVKFKSEFLSFIIHCYKDVYSELEQKKKASSPDSFPTPIFCPIPLTEPLETIALMAKKSYP